MMDGRENGRGNKEHVMQKEKQKERNVKFRKKRRESKHKTTEEINTLSLHSSFVSGYLPCTRRVCAVSPMPIPLSDWHS